MKEVKNLGDDGTIFETFDFDAGYFGIYMGSMSLLPAGHIPLNQMDLEEIMWLYEESGDMIESDESWIILCHDDVSPDEILSAFGLEMQAETEEEPATT